MNKKKESLAAVIFSPFFHQFYSPLTHVDHPDSAAFCWNSHRTGFPKNEPRVVSHAHAHAHLTLRWLRDVRAALTAAQRSRERLHERAHPHAEQRQDAKMRENRPKRGAVTVTSMSVGAHPRSQEVPTCAAAQRSSPLTSPRRMEGWRGGGMEGWRDAPEEDKAAEASLTLRSRELLGRC